MYEYKSSEVLLSLRLEDSKSIGIPMFNFKNVYCPYFRRIYLKCICYSESAELFLIPGIFNLLRESGESLKCIEIPRNL